MAALLFDMDGVLYEGDKSIEGALETVVWVQRSSIPHLFLTNTTSRPRQALVRKLGRYGIELDAGKILTPAVAATKWLAKHVEGAVALFVPPNTREEFSALHILDDDAESGAAAVVIGDLGANWTFANLNRAFRMLMVEPSPVLVALGMTRYWLAPGGLQLDVAPFVVGLEHATGLTAEVLGKPAAPFFATAISMLGESAENTIMIGDDIKGDIGAAQAVGIRGILVRTGKYLPSDLEQGIVPHAVLSSIDGLPRWWQHNMV